jgi:hypothetical protein
MQGTIKLYSLFALTFEGNVAYSEHKHPYESQTKELILVRDQREEFVPS